VDPAAWDRITIVRCGIDLEAFPLRPSRPSSAVPRILIVGRLVPEKGHIILVRAIARLRDEDVPFAVDIVGTGPFEAAIRAEANRLGVEDRIVFAGQVPSREVSERLREADIFCLPSFAEGLPIAIMEAMAVGVPVVTTYIAGIPELAVDRRTAMVVPAGNVDHLAAALRDLVGEPGLRDLLVAQARQAVEDHHVLSRSVASLAASFEDAVRSKTAS
jgi:glycosyltransferase involved in cell wall biosynthesis